MKRRHPVKRRHLVALAVAMSTAACAGPLAPLDVGSKDVPIDLLLGAKAKQVAEAPVPPALMPTDSVFYETVFQQIPRRRTTSPTTTPPPGPCPELDPLKVPVHVAENDVGGPPKAAEFEYRTKGKYSLGGLVALDIPLAPVSTVTIAPSAVDPAGNFTFDFTVKNKSTATTTTTYRVITTEEAGAPLPPIPPNVPENTPRPSGSAAGIYLAKVTTEGGTKPFEPQFPGIQMVRLPLDLGTVFDAAGTDGVTTMSWRSTVVEKKNVAACGTPLDSYVIQLSNGKLTGGEKGESVDFTWNVNLGTQYGGIPLHIDSETKGTAVNSIPPNSPVNRTVDMTINKEPQTV